VRARSESVSLAVAFFPLANRDERQNHDRENIDPKVEGRPRRRLYRLTGARKRCSW
jgi:hypothetical protein